MIYSIPIKVYVEDTDLHGIVFYANYLKYFERVRSNFLWERNDIKKLYPISNTYFIVTEINIKYKASAKLADKMLATIESYKVDGAKLKLQQAIKLNNKKIVFGDVWLACLEKNSQKIVRPFNI